MLYESHKKEPWFSLIASQKKSIDGRLRKGKWAEIKPGDFLLVMSEDEKNTLKTRVLAVNYYDSFREMLEALGVSNVLPGVEDIETALLTYRKIYKEEDERNFGVVAIRIELM